MLIYLGVALAIVVLIIIFEKPSLRTSNDLKLSPFIITILVGLLWPIVFILFFVIIMMNM